MPTLPGVRAKRCVGIEVSAAREGIRRSVTPVLSAFATSAWDAGKKVEEAEVERGRTKSTLLSSMGSGGSGASELNVEVQGEREGGSVWTSPRTWRR